MMKIMSVLGLALIACNVNAGLVSQSLGSLLTIRDCPTAGNESQCISESISASGKVTTEEQIIDTTNVLSYGNEYSSGTLLLDPSKFSLPEFKFEITSDTQQRNGVNLFAYQQYLWTGEDAVLEFTVDFNFLMSNDVWGSDVDSHYNVTVQLADDIYASGGFFPTIDGVLDSATFQSKSETILPTGAYFGSMSISQNVTTNQSFYLYTQVQSFAINGGFVDSTHTLTSQINGYDLSGAALDDTVLASALQVQNGPVEVSEPASIIILSVVLSGLAVRRRQPNYFIAQPDRPS